MGDRTGIAWTDATWNPTRGCRRISPGCENCYAERQAIRMSSPGAAYEGLVEVGRNGPRWTGKGRLATSALHAPLAWKGPRRIFVDSMSDLFFEAFSFEEIAAVFGVMAACPQHTFQVLTKRPQRALEWFKWHQEQAEQDGEPWIPLLREATAILPPKLGEQILEDGIARDGVPELEPWPLPNVWLGVSVEDQARADARIPALLSTPAAVRFLSVEPLLEAVDLTRIDAFKSPPWPASLPGEPKTYLDALRGTGLRPSNYGVSIETETARVDWVIVGGESGPGARPFHLAWARSIVEQCRAAGVACFVKQMGSKAIGSDGGRVIFTGKADDPNEWAKEFRVQEFPELVHPGGAR